MPALETMSDWPQAMVVVAVAGFLAFCTWLAMR